MFSLRTKKVCSKEDILQRACTSRPLCKEPDSYTLAESPPQNRIHMACCSLINTWTRSVNLNRSLQVQTLSFQRWRKQHVRPLFWDGISHSGAFHSVHTHKDGLAIRKYLENSASYWLYTSDAVQNRCRKSFLACYCGALCISTCEHQSYCNSCSKVQGFKVLVMEH